MARGTLPTPPGSSDSFHGFRFPWPGRLFQLLSLHPENNLEFAKRKLLRGDGHPPWLLLARGGNHSSQELMERGGHVPGGKVTLGAPCGAREVCNRQLQKEPAAAVPSAYELLGASLRPSQRRGLAPSTLEGLRAMFFSRTYLSLRHNDYVGAAKSKATGWAAWHAAGCCLAAAAAPAMGSASPASPTCTSASSPGAPLARIPVLQWRAPPAGREAPLAEGTF
ncbi:uncharacterized protein LOC118586583 [Onychomys torridus]|uniref:uncharacterized protein LOC118586583 n=1 Tax=Onychomys torridus TaxID=38674 RepID=UPI00167F6CDC|nr:uncharacterized protein LOC118586583 [Onychomys torridus]